VNPLPTGVIVRYEGVVVSETPDIVNVARAVVAGVTSPDAAVDGAKSRSVTFTPVTAAALAAAMVTEAMLVPDVLLRGEAMSHAATAELGRLVALPEMMGFWSTSVESSHVVATG
jgi:hypothetical protein